MFSAALRMAAHIPRKVRAAFVEEVRWPIYVLATTPLLFSYCCHRSLLPPAAGYPAWGRSTPCLMSWYQSQ